jgi:hypothetical protein
MKTRIAVALLLMMASGMPLVAGDKKNGNERGMLEKMEAVPCGANQKGFTGLGTLWASAGITKTTSNEKLCPQYLLRTDEMDYEIRPKDLKHATILPVGQEGEFKLKKNEMFLTFPEGVGSDHKTHAYQVVAMNPNKTDAGKESLTNVNTDQH